jgi:methylated-DNA-[protein]-cysteine S-methyltransferase
MENITGYYLSPLGTMAIKVNQSTLLSVKFHQDVSEFQIANPESNILQRVIEQLDEYFNSDRRKFDLPLQPEGTDFQLKVWDELVKIPYGETLSYLKLAERVGSYNYTRAVGLANGKNPIAIIIPCHRVIGASGELTGYAGGIWRKQWLLEHESMQKKLF